MKRFLFFILKKPRVTMQFLIVNNQSFLPCRFNKRRYISRLMFKFCAAPSANSHVIIDSIHLSLQMGRRIFFFKFYVMFSISTVSCLLKQTTIDGQSRKVATQYRNNNIIVESKCKKK